MSIRNNRTKRKPPKASGAVKKALSSPDDRSWIPVIYESYAGAFQADEPISIETALGHPTVYACVTQIASDIGKMRLFVSREVDGVWNEVSYRPIKGILRRPNEYQLRQKFIEQWLMSKLIFGNAYCLKHRDNYGKVIALSVLDPLRVQPLISDSGKVFYRLRTDKLNLLEQDFPAVPSSEIIHDTMECLFHPLVGVSPLFASGLAISQGLNIQKSSTKFFGNNSYPGGILSAPGSISDEVATRLKNNWETNYSGTNSGRIAVLGDGLRFEPIRMTAIDSELIKQLEWSDEKICSVFKVPPDKIYVGEQPKYNNAESNEMRYYSGCLQRHIESIESLLADGLDIPPAYRVEFDLDDLMRMDTASKIRVITDGVKGSVFTPNEGRKRFNYRPLEGGDTVYMQQQNYSLAALSQRDSQNPLGNENAKSFSFNDLGSLSESLRKKKYRDFIHE